MNLPEQDDDDDAPEALTVLCTLRSLAKWFPPDVMTRFGDRPAWFVLQDDEDDISVFEQLPEDPMQKGHVKVLMDGLRKFATERADALQQVLGVTDALCFGFHADASLDKVREAFEDDGFLVLEVVTDGEICLPDDEN